MKLRKAAAAFASGLFVVLGFAAPVAAEGTWYSYIDGFRVGDKSRSWSKNVTDGYNTVILLDKCYVHGQPSTNVRIQLTRETPWYQPDENVGRNDYHCTGSSSPFRVWGEPGAGETYHFVATHVAGSTSTVNQYSTCLSTGCVEVIY